MSYELCIVKKNKTHWKIIKEIGSISRIITPMYMKKLKWKEFSYFNRKKCKGLINTFRKIAQDMKKNELFYRMHFPTMSKANLKKGYIFMVSLYKLCEANPSCTLWVD